MFRFQQNITFNLLINSPKNVQNCIYFKTFQGNHALLFLIGSSQFFRPHRNRSGSWNRTR